MSFVKQMKILLPALVVAAALALSFSLAPVYADDAPEREPQTHDITIMMDEIQQPEVGQPFPELAVSQAFEAVQPGGPEGGVTGTDGFWQKESTTNPGDFQNVTDTVALPGTYRYCVTLSLDMTKKYTVEYIDDEDHPATKEYRWYHLEDDQYGFHFTVNGTEWETYVIYDYDDEVPKKIGCVSEPITVTGEGAELIFLDSDALDIPSTWPEQNIMPVSLTDRVGGGVPFTREEDGTAYSYYEFEKVSGPDWLHVSAEGEITGQAPAEETNNAELVVSVRDSAGTEKSITISVGYTGRDRINYVRAYGVSCDPLILHTIEEPQFTVIEGEPAEFRTAVGCWEYRSDSDSDWSTAANDGNNRFTAGQWRYRCVLSIEGLSGGTSLLTEDAAVFVDGTRWTASDYVRNDDEDLSQLTVTSPVTTIEKITIPAEDVTIRAQSMPYTGSPIVPKVTAAYAFVPGEYEEPEQIALREGEEFTVSTATDCIEPGSYTATITGTGTLTGSVNRTFSITQADISKDSTNAVIDIEDQTYTGHPLTPVPEITVTVNGVERTLVPEEDFTVTYENNTEVGEGKCIIQGTGSYTGTKTVYFLISKQTQDLTVSAGKTSLTPGKTTKITATGAQTDLSFSSSDDAVAEVDQSGNITAKKLGTAVITVTAAESEMYAQAEKSLTIKVLPAATASFTAANKASYIRLTWKKVTGATGYIIWRNNARWKKITSGSTLSFSDKKNLTNGKKYTYKIAAYASSGTSTLTKSRVIYRLARPAIKTMKNTKPRKLTVKWAKNAKGNGYIINYSTISSFAVKKTVNIKNKAKLSRIIKNLKKNKKYYVRIRAYKKVSGKTYYSAWSPVKSIKITR